MEQVSKTYLATEAHLSRSSLTWPHIQKMYKKIANFIVLTSGKNIPNAASASWELGKPFLEGNPHDHIRNISFPGWTWPHIQEMHKKTANLIFVTFVCKRISFHQIQSLCCLQIFSVIVQSFSLQKYGHFDMWTTSVCSGVPKLCLKPSMSAWLLCKMTYFGADAWILAGKWWSSKAAAAGCVKCGTEARESVIIIE